MEKFDELMIKYFDYYRIADTRIYIKFPPQKELRDDLVESTMNIMNLSYIKTDPISQNKMILFCQDETTFHKNVSLMMNYIGSKNYCPFSNLKWFLPEILGYDQFEDNGKNNLKEWNKWKDISKSKI